MWMLFMVWNLISRHPLHPTTQWTFHLKLWKLFELNSFKRTQTNGKVKSFSSPHIWCLSMALRLRFPMLWMAHIWSILGEFFYNRSLRCWRRRRKKRENYFPFSINFPSSLCAYNLVFRNKAPFAAEEETSAVRMEKKCWTRRPKMFICTALNHQAFMKEWNAFH